MSRNVLELKVGARVWFDGGDHNVAFHAVKVGLRWYPEGAGSSDALLTLAPVDRWFSYTANEVE